MGIDIEQIKLTREQKARLAELAERTGQSWSEVFDRCVQAVVAARAAETTQEGASTYVEDPVRWKVWFDEWISRQRSRNPNVDDSRDSVYRDRG